MNLYARRVVNHKEKKGKLTASCFCNIFFAIKLFILNLKHCNKNTVAQI
jgi:hypothetical protein